MDAVDRSTKKAVQQSFVHQKNILLSNMVLPVAAKK
jgi:hypothetical protein